MLEKYSIGIIPGILIFYRNKIKKKKTNKHKKSFFLLKISCEAKKSYFFEINFFRERIAAFLHAKIGVIFGRFCPFLLAESDNFFVFVLI